MRHMAFSAVLLLGACAPASENLPANKAEMARRLAELQNTAEIWRVYAQAYVTEAMQTMPDYYDFCETAADVDRCEATAEKMVSEMKLALDESVEKIELVRPALIDDYAKALAETYTADELNAALAFAESPSGRSINKKAAALYARVIASEYGRLRGWTNEIALQLTAIYNKHGRDFEPALSSNGTRAAN